MTLGAASCRIASILGQVGRLCPKSASLGRKQERYVGYAGIEFGSIPASRCVSTAFQRGMMRRDAAFRIEEQHTYTCTCTYMCK